MADRYDELYAATVANAQKQALAEIANEAQSVLKTADEQFKRGDSAGGAWTLRSYAALKNEYDVIAGGQQQQAPQQQYAPQQQAQPPPQYTQAEMDLMQHYPDQVRRNWNTAQVAANNLLASKAKADPEADLWAYRNSAEYINGIAHACGITDASGAESIEVQSPNEALAACQSKYGKVDAETYNAGVQKLIEMKKLGYYRPE
jgi:hypothetical protein